jgi:hypothetical protein
LFGEALLFEEKNHELFQSLFCSWSLPTSFAGHEGETGQCVNAALAEIVIPACFKRESFFVGTEYDFEAQPQWRRWMPDYGIRA